MMSITHTGVAITILSLQLPLYLTIPCAIFSHAIMDMFGEQTYNKWIETQIISHILLLIFSIITSNYILMLSGMILGNLFDILDKIIFMKIFNKELIHSAKWYPKVILNLSTVQTNMTDIIFLFLAIIKIGGIV